MTRALGEPLTDAERAAFIAACRARVGVKFRHRGRTARSLDCAGLIVVALASIGRPVDDLKVYGKFPHRDGLRDMIVANLGEPVADMQAGDVVLMRERGDPRHVAAVGEFDGRLTLIHASSDYGRVVEQTLAPYADRMVEVFRP